MTKTYINWNDFHKDCSKAAVPFINKRIDYIVALSRGGLVPARIINNFIDCNSILVLGLKLYNEYEAGEQVELYQDIPDLHFDRHSSFLIVDDISDSGKTLQYAYSHIFKKSGGGSIYSVTPYIKKSTSYIPASYSKCFPDDEWIVFPFEED